MSTHRPKIKIPFEPIDIAMEMISVTFLLLMWLHVIVNYSELPDTVATHFNSAGVPDDYGSKYFLWFLPILSTLMYLGIFWINRYPHLHNYMANITEKNAVDYYKLSTRTLRIVNLFCVLLFAYISYKIVKGAKEEFTDLGWGFIYVVITISIILPIILIGYQLKLKKKYNG
ncbi:MAG: DUF1648 domain-containing protein [Winogradskyella sp.]|nr:DUF1648 domain-containing protein [Winogradskyella sp.]NNC45229.1 DUF1648 domain-containing protein [Winogradskyella sp.]NNF85242.1 DUF1648 domain-containing protein [Winogradskyella sp.]NNL83755.1 DUF1648 domain-containing protein [Winogradskyella sp.]